MALLNVLDRCAKPRRAKKIVAVPGRSCVCSLHCIFVMLLSGYDRQQPVDVQVSMTSQS